MEIMFEQPYFVDENTVKQKFLVRSRNILWRGKVEATEADGLLLNRVKELISSSISDANRGYIYTKVGRINGRYMYKVRLIKNKKNNRLTYDDASSIQIIIYEVNGKARINMSIVPEDYI